MLFHTRVLAVKGVHVDVVAGTTSPLSQDEELAPRLDEFAQMVGYDSEPQAPYVGDGIVKEAFWRTMLNDALEPEPNQHERLIAEDETLFAWWWRILRDRNAQVPNCVIAFPTLGPVNLRARLRIIARSFWFPNDKRAFFTTQQGYMGFGPPDMRQGDLVAVLLGSRMPFILRQTPPPAIVSGSEGIYDNRYYTVVGYCYVHGLMKGKAVSENAKIYDINLI